MFPILNPSHYIFITSRIPPIIIPARSFSESSATVDKLSIVSNPVSIRIHKFHPHQKQKSTRGIYHSNISRQRFRFDVHIDFFVQDENITEKSFADSKMHSQRESRNFRLRYYPISILWKAFSSSLHTRTIRKFINVNVKSR